ncbi:MAG: hypothetical protein L0Z73_09970 [Gammaproteobacteria bacterium]|nr:hypothetical protein [Gammaproteobacteria bacterium]
MFNFFQTKPLLDEESIQWMFDCFGWALRNFDPRVFFDETILVTPTNECFPGKEHSEHGKANLILQQVKRYAGMANWPLQLAQQQGGEMAVPSLPFAGAAWGQHALAPVTAEASVYLPVTYQPELLRNPQALIANYAQLLAHYLGGTAREAPPGGEENWPHVTELLGVFMGFGLMFANTAYRVRVSSCGSCQGPVAERRNYLSQFDITYALAIFSVLKQIPAKEVIKHLKKTLHPFYKNALKDVTAHEAELVRLKGFQL